MLNMCVENYEYKICRKRASKISSINFLKTLDGGRVDGWVDRWMGGRQSRVKDCLQQSKSRVKDCLQQSTKKAWLLNGWVNGWMGGLKLNYNGGQFYKKT